MLNMHINRLFSILHLPLLLCLINCTPPDEKVQEYDEWTSANPLELPLRVRNQKFVQGNLVFNSSFEIGRIIRYDTLTSSIQVDGWGIIGEHVSWVSLDSDTTRFDSNLVHSGKGSICIKRTKASETESFGEGVISDYIKVIPGNYEFTLYLNLIDVYSPKAELGSRLCDAVNIRVVCYDRNKVEIPGRQYSPYHQWHVNNNYKSQSLSQFSYIDSTGWIHIHGKTRNYPYQDGDLQDETKFVRLQIGLKGIGTVLLDDVNFRYSHLNFSAIDGVAPYFDTTLTKRALIVPEPKKLEIIGTVNYYRPFYEKSFPVILIPGNANATTRRAANLLEERIKELLHKHTKIALDEMPNMVSYSERPLELCGAIIFSLGNTYLFRKYIEKMPHDEILGKDNGYFIHNLNDQNNIVFLDGNNSKGILYAVQSCLQLFDNNEMLFHNVNVVDYPSFENYALLLLNYSNTENDYISNCYSHRFSDVYLPGNSNNALDAISCNKGFSRKWLYFESDSTNNNEIISRAFKYSSLTEGVLLVEGNLGYPTNHELVERNFKPTSQETEIVNDRLLRHLCNSSIKELEIMLGIGDNVSLLNDLDKTKRSERHTPPGCYTNVWGGNKYQTWKLDEADLLFSQRYGQESSVFLDLSMMLNSGEFNYFAYDSLWPYKLQAASLFAPFNNQILPQVYNAMDKVIIAYKAANIFDKIRLQTVSDYFWNPEKYNPELSLYRAMVKELGEEVAMELIRFNHYYFKLKSEILLTKLHGKTNKHLRRIESFLKELQLSNKSILSLAGGDDITLELSKLISEADTLIKQNNIVLLTE